MITENIKTLIAQFSLGNVATVDADGWPAVSPKGTFLVIDDQTIAFGHIRSPGTWANLTVDTRLEVTFIDPFTRKGARLRGNATLHAKDSGDFAELLPRFAVVWPALAPRLQGIVTVAVSRCLPLSTPPYDDGATEEEMIALYRAKYQEIYP